MAAPSPSCCSSLNSYMLGIQKQMLITNKQAIICAMLFGSMLRKGGVMADVYELCDVDLKDFSIQGKSSLLMVLFAVSSFHLFSLQYLIFLPLLSDLVMTGEEQHMDRKVCLISNFFSHLSLYYLSITFWHFISIYYALTCLGNTFIPQVCNPVSQSSGNPFMIRIKSSQNF